MIDRIFLDWNRPILPAVARLLLDRESGGDFSGVTVSVPGSRAGRRLLELLVLEAQRRGWPLVPPTIVTVGRLPDLLLRHERPVLDETGRRLLWRQVLAAAPPEMVAPITTHRPGAEEPLGWFPLARLLESLQQELATEGLIFEDVARLGLELPEFDEEERWLAAAALQAGYRKGLEQLGSVDPYLARRDGAEDPTLLDAPELLVMVGVVELHRTTRSILENLTSPVLCCVHAPKRLAATFDTFGTLVPSAWTDAFIPLDENRLQVVDRPPDQADAVVQWIDDLDGRFARDEITVGVGDEELVPLLQQRLERVKVTGHYGGGVPLELSAPYRLLEVVAELLREDRFSSLASLVRHPDFEWSQRNRTEDRTGDRLPGPGDLDRYHARHLPATVAGALPSEAGGNPIEALRAHVEMWLGPLKRAPRPLNEWSQPLGELLRSIYRDQRFDTSRPAGRRAVEALVQCHDALSAWSTLDPRLSPDVSAGDALRLTLESLEGQRIPDEVTDSGLEILGWLELSLDDAPALVLTGVHEGLIPASAGAHPFLPNTLRRHLGLPDDQTRLARDAHALRVIRASRRALHLVVGRRDSRNDPLTPSRLLFAADSETVARRVQRIFGPTPSSPAKRARWRPGKSHAELAIPRPSPPPEPLRSLRVTGFRDYLACPYRFYLRHVEKLRPRHDRAEEMDPLLFGSLAHDVLESFGREEILGREPARDADALRERLDSILDAALDGRFGGAPLPAVRIQGEQLRTRLHRFADWQAAHAEAGWRIETVELSVSDEQAPFGDFDPPFFLTGRIDRVDVHGETGRRILFDYKTSEQSRTPEKMHRHGGAWIDLQLPLYRHLAAAAGLPGQPRLAYLGLPRTGAIEAHYAEWDEIELLDADAVAREVIQKVRQNVFWPPASGTPRFFDEFAAICQDGQRGTEGDAP